MMISEWGENPIISYLADLFPSPAGIVGIGDDCAVIPLDDSSVQLVTTDALIEGIHFIKDQICAYDLGYKTFAVNVSDIAAMGGTPQYAFLSIALPSNTDCIWFKEFAEGMREACKEFSISLLGGDTVGSKSDIFINLTVMGKADIRNIKYRHTALPGDVICVSGPLGDSLAGLLCLQKKMEQTSTVKCLIKAHQCPQIGLEKGLFFGSQSGVHAMMDLSDGLDTDLRRILKASNCGAVIDLAQIPISKELAEIGKMNDWNTTRLAVTGGEDYRLLVTIATDAFEEIRRAFHERFTEMLFPIGIITNQPDRLTYTLNGKPIEIQISPYQHF